MSQGIWALPLRVLSLQKGNDPPPKGGGQFRGHKQVHNFFSGWDIPLKFFVLQLHRKWMSQKVSCLLHVIAGHFNHCRFSKKTKTTKFLIIPKKQVNLYQKIWKKKSIIRFCRRYTRNGNFKILKCLYPRIKKMVFENFSLPWDMSTIKCLKF